LHLKLNGTEKAVREAFENLDRTAQEMGLWANEGKTKYMEVTTRPTGQKIFKVINYDLECVNEFKYLGTLVANSHRITAEIDHRVGTVNRCYHRMKDMLISRYMETETKGKPYNHILKSVLTYERESWTLTKGDEQILRAFERKVLGNIYGPTREKEG
jgi:hypothetical protein